MMFKVKKYIYIEKYCTKLTQLGSLINDKFKVKRRVNWHRAKNKEYITRKN